MALAWVYAHHGEALEAELRAQYGVELEEEDEIASSTVRKLWVYYDQLPSMNRITREILEIDRGENVWHDDMPMIADLIDAVNYNTYAIAQVNSKQKVKPPKPYPRPDYGKKVRLREAAKADPTPKRNRLPGAVKYIPKVEPKAREAEDGG